MRRPFAFLAQVLLLSSLSAQPAPAAAQPAAGRAETITVDSIEISGNTALADGLLDNVAAPYRGRPLTDRDLQDLLSRLNAVHAQAGYATSRAVLPDQDASRGELRITIVEGYLERIEVDGDGAVDAGYLRERLQVGIARPLNVAILNANLRLLMQERGMGELRAELRPGSAPGAAVLHVHVNGGTRFEGGLRAANDRAPAVGGVRGAVELGVRNLFGRGDSVDIVYGKADGLNDLDFRLEVPLNALGSVGSLRYFDVDSELVDEQFSVLGAKTEIRGFEVGLSQSLWRRPGREVSLQARFASRQSFSTLLGEPFSFSPGVDNGKADVKAARLGAQWIERGARDYLSARFTFTQGIGALGATVHDDGLPDSRHQSTLAQWQWLHTLGPRAGQVYLRADAQWAFDALLPLEKFGVGGLGSVRGYRRARFVRDSGWSSALEYRLPLLRLALDGGARGADAGQLQLVLFADAGRAWNHGDPDDAPRTLLAAGPGLRWDPLRDVRAEFYWGGWRRHLDGDGDDIQDRGLHFLLSARRRF